MKDNAETMFLEFNIVSKSYDGLQIFKNLSICLKPGIAYGLIGPNACGKTTLLHAAMGLVRLDKGNIYYCGQEITGQKPHAIAGIGLGIVLQNIGIFHKISVFENVLAGLAAYRRWSTTAKKNEEDNSKHWSLEERAMYTLGKMGLEGYENRLAGSLVPGEQKRLAIARTLFSSRDFLFDEPVSGVDSSTRESLHELIRELVEDDRSMLIVEHDIDFVLETCDEIMLLKDGGIACQGSPSSIRDRGEFREFYSSLRVES